MSSLQPTLNPNGIPAASPGLRPGGGSVTQPRLGLKNSRVPNQDSSFLATLGWRIQSRWDCRARLRACLKTLGDRRVGARGLQDLAEKSVACRPGALTGRVFKHALKFGRNYATAGAPASSRLTV